MSKVLKAGEGQSKSDVRNFKGQVFPPLEAKKHGETAPQSQPESSQHSSAETRLQAAASIQPTRDAAQGQITQLKMEAETLQRKLEEMATRTDALQSEAFEKGKQEGLLQSKEENTRRHDLLAKALSDANQAFAEKKGQIEILALQIARTSLERLIGDSGHQATLLEQLIRYQLNRFADDRPSALHVSASDFPVVDQIGKLSADWPGLNLVVDRGLKAGECNITLELGEVEIGLSGQMTRLRAYFDALASEHEAPAPSAAPSPVNGGASS